MNEKYMKIAILEAKKALKRGEMPVGAVIVENNKILSMAFNKKEKTKNAIMHAEIIAIQKACKVKKDWRLDNCDIYITMEPCMMCLGAILESRIKNIYCGVRNYKTKTNNDKIYKNEKINFTPNLYKDEISSLVNDFFKIIRNR